MENLKPELVLKDRNIDLILKRINESENEKIKIKTAIRNKLELLINKTPTGELRNELTDINILLTLL